ncbi:nodulation protein NolB [Bradyrhizobium sp. Arg237L]|uniref:nodulation protein NolB n=1 Tax=Bradyrhizobium sp. Arg237L TaxID=3003352 RepID=UPI00249E0E40|nr:nodulation protein NolB [Bradyrhizobium sp. Arg237L]MDI4231934.1 nodulation protein NolB [Bradyrhizobium sp. Arg237L]
MTVGAISSGAAINCIGTGGVMDSGQPQTMTPTAAQGQEFARSYAAAREAAAPSAAAVPPAEPQREISRPTTRNDSLGERILDRLEAIHRNDKLGNADVKKAPSAPLLKVASAEPGPAASALREVPSGAPDLTAKDTRTGQFSHMLEQLQKTYGQVIQVSVVSKSSGSFTSSMNRLMSSS